MSPRDQVHAVAARVCEVARGVTDDQLSEPTPCSEMDVRALVHHLLGTSEAMRRIGAGEELDPDDPWGTGGDPASVPGTWRDDLAARLDGLARVWSSDAAWEGQAMGGAMPKAAIGQMGYVEVVLHGWDLARATGQEHGYDEASAHAALQVMETIGEMGREQGAFGSLVDVPEDSAALDRALALSGRDPAWTPS